MSAGQIATPANELGVLETAWDRLWPALSQHAPTIVAVTEYDAICQALGNCAGQTILDLGCGIGQPVTTFAKASGVFAVDFSMEALTRYRTHPSSHVVKVHATALRLPFADHMFDVVVAAQLLPHLAREQRGSVLREVARILKPGGKAIVTTLHYNFRFPKLGMAKTGMSDGVYFFLHSADEFREELAGALQVRSLWGVWNYLPKTYQLFMRLGRKTLYWDRLVRRTPLSLRYGKQLVAVCRLRSS